MPAVARSLVGGNETVPRPPLRAGGEPKTLILAVGWTRRIRRSGLSTACRTHCTGLLGERDFPAAFVLPGNSSLGSRGTGRPPRVVAARLADRPGGDPNMQARTAGRDWLGVRTISPAWTAQGSAPWRTGPCGPEDPPSTNPAGPWVAPKGRRRPRCVFRASSWLA